MDPLSLAAATVVAKWFVEGVGKQIGGTAIESLKRVYEAVRSAFSGKHEETAILERLKEKPSSEARALELAEALDNRIKTDPEFRDLLSAAIEKASEAPDIRSFVTQVMYNARVGRIVNVGVVHGGAKF
jgi:hypothetical protein